MDNISKIFAKEEVDKEVDKEVEDMMNSIKEELQAPFVPNFFKVWSDAPEALKGIFPAMKHILTKGHLSRPLKEMIILAISSRNNCDYCVAAHQTFASMMGVSSEHIEAIKSDNIELNDPKLKGAIAFALKLADSPSSNSLEDIKNLKSLNYSKAEILEIIAMSGMSVFYNHLADATQINIDKAFLAS